MRKYYWYIVIFCRKHGLVVVGSIIAAVFVFSLALPILNRFLDFKKTVYVGVIGKYSLSNLPLPIQQEISSGLTKVQLDGSVTPALAERWSTEEEGKSYRFVIRKNILWQDGKPFQPSDVHYQFNDVQIKNTANDVVFKLKDHFVPFPTVVSRPLLKIIRVPYLFFFTQDKIIGIGENEVQSYKANGERIDELTVNEKRLRKIYRFYPTEDDALSAFKRGEIDELTDLSGPQDVQMWPNTVVNKKLDTQSYLAVFFNTHDDLFKSNDLRQALNYALPKPVDDTRVLGPISPKSWAYADVGKHYDFDQQRAIDRILSPLVLPHLPIHIDLTTTPLFTTQAEKVKEAWESFGLKAAAQCQTSSTVKDKTLCNNTKIQVNIKISYFPDLSNYQVLLIGETSPTDPDQYQLWHSLPVTNFTHYKNVRIDSLLEKGRQIEDQKKRFEIYSEFQQFFSEDAPVIFLQYLYKYDIARKGK